jgi:prophage antirepressor-like protein
LTQNFVCVNEGGLYELIFTSGKKEAIKFRHWVTHTILPALRKAAGLSEYEAFRMLDTEKQKAAVGLLNDGLLNPVRIDFVKSNCTADKAVSTLYGFPKMLKKRDMNEAMLRDRQIILEDTVQLMLLNERLGLGLSVSKAIYGKYCAVAQQDCAV